jgi:hypothetical protein
MNKQL